MQENLIKYVVGYLLFSNSASWLSECMFGAYFYIWLGYYGCYIYLYRYYNTWLYTVSLLVIVYFWKGIEWKPEENNVTNMPTLPNLFCLIIFYHLYVVHLYFAVRYFFIHINIPFIFWIYNIFSQLSKGKS